MTPGPLLLAAALGVAAGIVAGPRAPRTWLALTLAATVAALTAAILVLAGGAPWEWRSGFSLGGEPLHLRLDSLSAWFLTLLSVVGGGGTAYAHGYWTDTSHPRSAPRGRRWWNAIILSLGTVLLSSNGLHFLIAWELFALSGYFLITLERQRRDVRAAGWLYLAASHASTLGLFMFFSAIAARTGSWEFGPMRDHPELAPFFWLALAGFGLKAGLFPLHIWLPSAHASAPSHVSAILSGVAIKLGVYGVIRFSGWLPIPPGAGWTVIVIGAITALLGIAFAFVQNDFKRLLAYCSVENIGIILVGLGFALTAAAQGDLTWGRLALAGALLHVLNHGLFKSLLFFTAGAVLHATGTREMSRLGGLWRAMPWTAGLFVLGALAVCGLPPLNGFVSEWLVYLGLLEVATGRGTAAWTAMPAMIVLGITGALALASFAKTGALVFLGAPRTAPARRAHECNRWMRGPMLVLGGLCVALGLAPVVFWPAVARAVGTWRSAWVDTPAPAPLFTVGALHLALLVLAGGLTAILWRRAGANGFRNGLTWDCGYAAPSARMQYTSGSFAAIGAGWFAWILQPWLRWQRPHGLFPGRALRLERFPETVLERAIEPAGGMILQLALAARRAQHGALRSYIAYIVVALAALGTFVAWGGSS